LSFFGQERFSFNQNTNLSHLPSMLMQEGVLNIQQFYCEEEFLDAIFSQR